MVRVARIRATRMSRGTSPSGRQLCAARGVSRGIASHVNPSPQGRHFDDRKAPGGRQRASRMMLNNRCPIRTSMPSAAPEGAWREVTAQFPQAYALGLKNLSPQGGTKGLRLRHGRGTRPATTAREDLVGHGRGTRPATTAREDLVGHGRGTRPAIEAAMARVARIRATRMSRGTSPSGRQLCPARGVSRGIASHVNPSPQGRHFDDRKAPGGRQRASRMMLNNRCTIRTSMPSAAPEGAWREATAQFPQAYAVGLKNLSPQGASLTTRSRHETCHNSRAKTT